MINPLDLQQTSTRHIPVPPHVFSSPAHRVSPSHRGEERPIVRKWVTRPTAWQPPHRKYIYPCVWSQVCSSHLFRLLFPPTEISFDGRRHGRDGGQDDGGSRRHERRLVRALRRHSGGLCVQQAVWRNDCDIDLMLPGGSLPASSSPPSPQRMGHSWAQTRTSRRAAALPRFRPFLFRFFLFCFPFNWQVSTSSKSIDFLYVTRGNGCGAFIYLAHHSWLLKQKDRYISKDPC